MQAKQVAVLGLGVTGLSVVNFLSSEEYQVTVFDTRDCPPGKDKLTQQTKLVSGPLEGDKLAEFPLIIASPGIALSTPALQTALSAGCEIIGDIELFARKLKTAEYKQAKCVTITGSNGKSTVTSLLGEMAKSDNVNVAIGGNIGVPALDLLSPDVTLYILELSSFQLETTTSLNADIATILNISEDHLDRYNDYQHYIDTKHLIYKQCKKVLFNREDLLTTPRFESEQISFGFSTQQYGLIENRNEMFISRNGKPLICTDKIKLSGKHNWLNATAAIALGDAVGINETAMLKTLQTYKGLAHRCEFITELNGVRWINDSKATNIGATQAALIGLSDTIKGNVHVILGGEGKGADFIELKKALSEIQGEIICIGTDAKEISKQHNAAKVVIDLQTAVNVIYNAAKPGDLVILSPACASFDMFDNFMARGDCFKTMVLALDPLSSGPLSSGKCTA